MGRLGGGRRGEAPVDVLKPEAGISYGSGESARERTVPGQDMETGKGMEEQGRGVESKWEKCI